MFVKNEPETEDSEEAEPTEVPEEQMRIDIRLNERGKNGANIRQIPSLEGDIIVGVNDDSIILYQNEWENDGERYWIKIYLPDKQVSGWLSGKLIEDEQLKMILSLSG